ncbi:MAG: TVP38/TMEM64 family protein [Oligoflexus sp.]
MRGEWWTPLVIIIIYPLSHLILFPNTVLNTIVILTFGGFQGWLYAIAGSLASTVCFYMAGRKLGERKIAEHRGEHFEKIKKLLRKGGVGAVIAVRLLPIAPYPVVCLSGGAIGIRFWSFILGTFVAHLPATLTLAIFGQQLRQVFRDPEVGNFVILIAVLAIGALILWLFKKFASSHMDNASIK